MAETRQSVHVHYREAMSHRSVFKVRLKVLRSSADYDREFQIEGALMLNVFADNMAAVRGPVVAWNDVLHSTAY